MEPIYYSPRGYWKSTTATCKLADLAGVKRDVAADWLSRDGIWQMYLPPAETIKRGGFDVSTSNEVHQADVLFLPHYKVLTRTYQFPLTVFDFTNIYKEVESLSSKKAIEVAAAFE